MIEVPGCDYIYTERDNEKALQDWKSANYDNESMIGSMFRLDIDFYKFSSWYPAIMKMKDESGMTFMYPILFRDVVKRRTMKWSDPYSRSGIYDIDVGPSIEENEICVSKKVMESLVWRGFLSQWKLENGVIKYKSLLDSNQNCAGPCTAPINVEIIPYSFEDKLLDYFDSSKDTYIGQNFNFGPLKPNPWLESIDEKATNSITLARCYIGEQGMMQEVDISDGACSNWIEKDIAYFLSFTSYGTVNIIYDRQRLKEAKKLRMETPKSIEEAMMEYNDWTVTIGEKNPTEARIVVDNSGVSIDNIDNIEKEEKKVEESDELLI